MRSPGDSIWGDVLQFSLQMLENGLRSADTTLQQVQLALTQLAGQPSASRGKEAPVEGPVHLAAATSELANRLLRRAQASNRAPSSWGWDLLDAARRSLPQETLWNPRHWLALPLQLPVAMTTLSVQEALRTLVILEAVRPEVWGDFFAFVMEVFSDLHVYFSLQYGEELQRYQQHLQQYPDDAQARLELGRTLMKCGLFQEAIEALELAAQVSCSEHRAHYERPGGELSSRRVRAGD